MLIVFVVVLISLLVGPIAFWFFSHILYKNSKYDQLKKYPTQINDLYGDIIFLPMFNGIFAWLITNSNFKLSIYTEKMFILILTSLILSFIFTFCYVYYQKNIADYLDWSKPEKGKLNIGGIYHSIYMLVQMFIIILGLFLFYNNFYLLFSIAGYLGLTLMQIHNYGYT
jgi:hypothetical protein